MATEAQINANRQNAKHSTGPVTESGKSNSSKNHLTLGLYTRHDYVKPEERDFYKEFCETMFTELNPAGLLEQTLASEVTGASWRLRRCNAAEADLADYATQDPLLDEASETTRRSIDRARASAHSILHRSLNQLRKLKKDRTDEQKLNIRLAQQGEKAETDAMEHAVDIALSGIMNCPEPDWDEIDRRNAAEGHAAQAASLQSQPNVPAHELASNCTPGHAAEAASSEAPQMAEELGSNCTKTPTQPLAAALMKRNLPCACKSGIIYRNCCGKTEPRDWRKAA